EGYKNETCSICLKDIKSPALTDCCHIFCEECITLWLNKRSNCPLCKAKVNKNNLFLVTEAVSKSININVYNSLDSIFKAETDINLNVNKKTQNKTLKNQELVLQNITNKKQTKYCKAELSGDELDIKEQ